jgi:hypothetical protein
VLDPDRPYAYLNEREPQRDGSGNTRPRSVSTLFLTASTCPIGCTMCDLHRNTLAVATSPGAIVRQIEFAQRQLPAANWIKLYNSGNFFDPRSIPPQDGEAICARCAGYQRVIVENHPRFGNRRHEAIRDSLDGRLEIAVGLETVQPRWLERMGKRMRRDDFDRYARQLQRCDIDLRVFLIVGVPGITLGESLRWARLSVRHAIAAGARHISLIPARAGHGWAGHADRLPEVTPDALTQLLGAALDDAPPPVCIAVDLWDLDRDIKEPSSRDQLRRLAAAVLHQDASRL